MARGTQRQAVNPAAAPLGRLLGGDTHLPTNPLVENGTSPPVEKPTKGEKPVKFSVHGIDPRGPLVRRLKQYALDKDRTVSDIVQEALTQWLERVGG